MDTLLQLLVNGLVAGSIYALVAMGFSLIYGTTRFFNLAHGSIAAVGGYGVFLFSRLLGWPLWSGVILGVLCAGLAGWALDKLIYLPLRRRKASGMILLVASLGVFTVIPSLFAIAFGTHFHNLIPSTLISVLRFGSVVFTQVQLIVLGSSVLVFAILVLGLRFTRLGRVIRAGLLLKGVIAAIVGGIGSIPGAILGGFLLGSVENLGIWQIGAEWKEAIAFALLILFLVFRPEGIVRRR
ncbi:MAG: ABC-type transporter, integral membrane subunit [Parcubacteria group bacterium GW2011_GWA2_56_7]|nr:MAG: ABC-type transporter, integral membrane subunit [Parcubacteria group bacterium GW2011_GWA2_56_7]